MGKYITAILALAMLAGCACGPISKDLRNQAQPLNLTQVTANPKTTRGDVVIWGGRIVNTSNSTNGGNIYVVQRPLSRCQKPSGSDPTISGGRFIAASHEFLDPAVYRSGRLVTVAGQICGVRNERLGNVIYAYPIIEIRQIHVWGRRRQTDNRLSSAYPGWYWSYDPVWWDGGAGLYSPGGFGHYEGGESRSGGAHR